MIQITAVLIGGALALLILVGVFHAIVQSSFPYLRKVNEDTKHAYGVLFVGSGVFLLFGLLHLRIEKVEIAGIKASVGELGQRVDTLAQQVETLYKEKQTETFNAANWYRVRRVGKNKDGILLEVTLAQEPIPNSVEVYEGVLRMPPTRYKFDGAKVRFPANTDRPTEGLTISYFAKPKTTSR